MSIHTCTITGSQNVMAGFSKADPCGDMEDDCTEKSVHFERADCCEMQQTAVVIKDDAVHSFTQAPSPTPPVTLAGFFTYTVYDDYQQPCVSVISCKGPPEPSALCIFRI